MSPNRRVPSSIQRLKSKEIPLRQTQVQTYSFRQNSLLGCWHRCLYCYGFRGPCARVCWIVLFLSLRCWQLRSYLIDVLFGFMQMHSDSDIFSFNSVQEKIQNNFQSLQFYYRDICVFVCARAANIRILHSKMSKCISTSIEWCSQWLNIKMARVFHKISIHNFSAAWAIFFSKFAAESKLEQIVAATVELELSTWTHPLSAEMSSD